MTWAVPTIGGIQRMTRSLAGAISLVLLVVVSLAAPMDCAYFYPYRTRAMRENERNRRPA